LAPVSAWLTVQLPHLTDQLPSLPLLLLLLLVHLMLLPRHHWD
jgi:hypothetical protein